VFFALSDLIVPKSVNSVSERHRKKIELSVQAMRGNDHDYDDDRKDDHSS